MRRLQPPLRWTALATLSLWTFALAVFQSVQSLSLDAAADVSSDELVIDGSSDLHKLLQCSHNRPIGFFNEYYQVCSLASHAENATVRHVVIRDAVLDLLHFSHSLQFHVELDIALDNASATSITLQNSTILASAVRLVARNISIDARSSVNVSVAGFKFGPGYNSWYAMGGSYGGTGGVAVADDLKGKCDDAPHMDFFKNIGDVAGGVGNFRGYGSGGGSDDSCRGGGRIEIQAFAGFALDGSLLANGGDAVAPGGESTDSAGAGGTVVVDVSVFTGNGTIQSNGGRPSAYEAKDSSGGGGGGGGGRVVVTYDSLDDVKWAHIQAFGGGVLDKASPGIVWCQLGGDGTVYRIHRSRQQDASVKLVGTLVIAGQRAQDTTKPVQMYACTTIFQWTSRAELFVPNYTAHVSITGGAALCTAFLRLEPKVEDTNSSIVIEAGSHVRCISGSDTMTLGADSVLIQSHIGPPSNAKDSRFDVLVDSGFVALANAKLTVRSLHVTNSPSFGRRQPQLRDADRGFTMDKFSGIQFRDAIQINVQGDVHVLGFLQPDGEEFLRARSLAANEAKAPSVSISTPHTVEFTPNTAQIGALSIDIHADGDATVDLPFETSQLSLAVAADNLIVSRVAGGGMQECAPIKTHADAGNCAALWGATTASSPYLLSFFGKSTFVAGNITGGSILSCTNGPMRVEGWLVSDGLGCSPNKGPGKSAVVESASGGAGHGGRGGNVEPGNAGGGKAFDNGPSDNAPATSWPIWPGSGAASDGTDAGSVVAGHGGGLIYVNAKQLAFSRPNASRLSARGSTGTVRGGGGAGGAIALFVEEMSGPGVVDVSGGDSTTATRSPNADDKPVSGGGGGGGIIRVTFQASGNGDAFLKDGGAVLAVGGKSPDGGEAGGDGVMVATNCSAGRGGVLCKPCDVGSFSPVNDGRCQPCGPGSFADHAGMPACALCLPGTFTSKFGQAHCAPCEAGTFSRAAGAKACSPCPPGSFSSVGGSAECTLCPIGTITDATSGHNNCTLCGIGETTRAAGSLHCIGCTNKPEHASFNVRGNCTYACEKGRNGLDCLTPFERLVKPIGGPMGFVLLVFAFTSTIFGSWGFLTYRNTQRSKHRYAEYKAQTLRDELSLANLTQKLTPRLTDQDLAGHVARLYFEGENHLESSWVLDPYAIPKALRDLVRDDSYAALATACNDLLVWPVGGWEFWSHRALLLSVPPAATVFLRRRQLRRVERLAKFIEQYAGSFVRDIGFRVHGGVQLKVGFSPDFSLAYIDVTTGSTMAPSNATSPSQKLSVTSERITIVVAGSGSFFRPFYIDTNDVMVRSVPTRLGMLQHAFWIDFAAEVNQRLRLIPQMTSTRRVQRSAVILQDIVAFVVSFNQQHRRDAIVVSVGVVDGVDFHPLSQHVEDVASWLEQWVRRGFNMHSPAAKLAFRVSRRGNCSESPGTLEVREETAREPVGGRSSEPQDDELSGGISQDPRPIEFRHSRIRMEALFARSPKSGSSSSSVDSDDTTEPLLDSSSSKRSRHAAAQRRASYTGASMVCSSQSKIYERLATVLAPIAPAFRLHNTRAVTLTGWSLLLLPISMILLIVCDIAIVFFVMMEFYCVQVDDPTPHDSGCSRVAFVVVQSILPLALLGVPTLGLIFLSRKSIFYGKLFATWTIGSLVNLVVGMVCAVVYIHYVRESVLWLLIAGVFIKLLEKEVALRCVAQYTIERPLRGWRGLHTTKDWYDAAYTPLVHQER